MLIAARNGFLAGGELSAKSYVQDGLVAMWDGIENAGWGVHDSNSLVWKSLVGNVDVPLSSSGRWTDNSLTQENTTDLYGAAYIAGNSRKFTLSTYQTFEVVFLLTSNTNNRSVIAAFMSPVNIAAQMSYQWFLPCGDGGTHLAKYISYGTKYSISTTVNPQYDVSMMVANGESVTTRAGNSISYGSLALSFLGGRSTNSTAYGKLYSVRLYSRALTAAEIAANYDIDKARFNLP